ncbi:MAG TPA: DUF1345 domain-containing protein [Methylovirgula sp.]|jgi:uncharacterized membrane protein
MTEATPTPMRRSRLGLPVRLVRSRPRLFIGMALGVCIGLFLPGSWRVATRLLISWNVGAFIYFILAAVMVARATPEWMARKAESQDEGRFGILVFSVLAAAAAFGAIIAQLGSVKDMQGTIKSFHVALASVTIVSAWTLIHLMFALHYAHEFMIERAERLDKPPKRRGGLTFPGTEMPDYLDFLYFSYVIGVACQTADVEICSRDMRRLSLVHCVLAFFFNSAVLALTINIAAGLI